MVQWTMKPNADGGHLDGRLQNVKATKKEATLLGLFLESCLPQASLISRKAALVLEDGWL